MKKSLAILGILLSTISFSAKADYLGLWTSQKAANGNQATIKIFEQHGKIFGQIVHLTHPKKDVNNKDKSKRNRNIEGITIISSFKYNEKKDKFEGGLIYDPESGNTYHCILKLQDKNTLKVRGHIGIEILGRTEIWKRK